jgi:hypothetical protein
MTVDGASEAAAPDDSGNAAMDATLGTADASGADAAIADAANAPYNEGTGFVQSDGSLPAYSGGDIFQRLCIDPPTNVNFAFDTIKAPYTDAAGCMAFNNQGHPAVHNCFCAGCFELMQQCDALPGCQQILKCELDAGCTDSNSCYLLPGAPCYSVINSWGTGSVMTALTSYLQTCGQGLTPACPSQ